MNYGLHTTHMTVSNCDLHSICEIYYYETHLQEPFQLVQ